MSLAIFVPIFYSLQPFNTEVSECWWHDTLSVSHSLLLCTAWQNSNITAKHFRTFHWSMVKKQGVISHKKLCNREKEWNACTPHPEMEKGGRSGHAVCAKFYAAVQFLKVFFTFFVCNFWHFFKFLHTFEHFLHISCVLIFQTRSFAGAIL